MFHNKRFLILILISFALLFSAMFSQNADIAWMMIPFLIVIGTVLIQGPETGLLNLQVTRSAEKTHEEGAACIEITLTIENHGPALQRVTLSDLLPKGTSLINGKLEQTLRLKSGETGTYHYTLQAERGLYNWQSIQVTVADWLGINQKVVRYPCEAEVQVQPQIKKFRAFTLRPQSTLHTAGSIPARRAGRGIQFWGVREYHPGDPLTHLDWRLTARHPHQFFTKENEQEEIADIGLVLDARQTTNIKVGKDCIFEHSVNATASLAEVFLRQGNRVSLLIYGEPMVFLYPGYGKNQLNKILYTLSQASIDSNRSPDSFIYLPTNVFSSHSLLIFVSPLAPMDHKLFPRLRALNFQVLLISPNPMQYARRLINRKPASQLALHLTEMDHLMEILKISNLWIPIIDWSVDQPLAPLVRQALNGMHIQRQH